MGRAMPGCYGAPTAWRMGASPGTSTGHCSCGVPGEQRGDGALKGDERLGTIRHGTRRRTGQQGDRTRRRDQVWRGQ